MDADIICLQECDLNDLNVIKDKIGRTYIERSHNTKDKKQIFIKNQKFEDVLPENIIHKNRFFILKLQGKTSLEGHKFVVVNAHLSTPTSTNSKKKSYENSNQQLDQIKKELGNYKDHIKIVCGDFNNPFYNNKTAAENSTGSNILTDDDFLKDAYKVSQSLNINESDDNSKVISSYKGIQMHPIYPKNNPVQFKEKDEFYGLIDYILYDNKLTVSTVLQLPQKPKIDEYTVKDTEVIEGKGFQAKDLVSGKKNDDDTRTKKGLPNLFRTTEGDANDYESKPKMIVFPSDHVPLYAEFKIKGDAGSASASDSASAPSVSPPSAPTPTPVEKVIPTELQTNQSALENLKSHTDSVIKSNVNFTSKKLDRFHDLLSLEYKGMTFRKFLRNKTDITRTQIPADKLESLALIQGINFAPDDKGSNDKLILVGTDSSGVYAELNIDLEY